MEDACLHWSRCLSVSFLLLSEFYAFFHCEIFQGPDDFEFLLKRFMFSYHLWVVSVLSFIVLIFLFEVFVGHTAWKYTAKSCKGSLVFINSQMKCFSSLHLDQVFRKQVSSFSPFLVKVLFLFHSYTAGVTFRVTLNIEIFCQIPYFLWIMGFISSPYTISLQSS